MFALLMDRFGGLRRPRLEAKQPPEPESLRGEPREMVGFFARLTPEQKKRALNYRGPDYLGDPAEGGRR